MTANKSRALLKDIVTFTGYSLPEIACLTGIPLTQLRRIHDGVIKKPNVKVFRKILALYCLRVIK